VVANSDAAYVTIFPSMTFLKIIADRLPSAYSEQGSGTARVHGIVGINHDFWTEYVT
jgi:hypothetical protein